MNKQRATVNDGMLASLHCSAYKGEANGELQCFIQYHYLENIKYCDMCRQCAQFYERMRHDDYNSVKIFIEE